MREFLRTCGIVCFATLLAGRTLVIMPRLNPDLCLNLTQSERVTHAFMVAPQSSMTLSSPAFGRYDLSLVARAN
jgi:non-ribosomal peptide synthetase component E (peptide arylation enzyme)